MIKKTCVVCGAEFSAKKEHAKYCSVYCKNRSRYPRSRNDWINESRPAKSEAVHLYNSEYTVEEIAKRIGKSSAFVYQAWREAGLPKRMSKLQKEVAALREQGKCSSEIADTLRITIGNVYNVSKSIGMPFTEEEKQRSKAIGIKKNYRQFGNIEKKYSDFMRANHPGWRYISGKLNDDGFMMLQCEKCGSTVKKSAITVRRKEVSLVCPVCMELHKQEKAKEEEAERNARKREKIKQFWSQDFRQVSFRFYQCKECGAPVVLKRNGYCSEECKRKHMNRAHDKRLERADVIDKTISLKKLYKRDGGICWLCGGKCDYDDCFKDENGNFIVGANYPSIDHVYPLSKGGNHVWNNIKLAHHYCNTLKNDRVVLYG